MDGWQAAQNWLIFGAVVAGAVYYYYPQNPRERRHRPALQPSSRTQSGSKAIGGKRSSSTSSSRGEKSLAGVKNTSSDSSPARPAAKRKTELLPVADVVDASPEKGADDSNRAFAQSMLKARQGIEVNKAQNKSERVKTVKPKTSASQVLPSASSPDEFDDGDWSHVVSTPPKASGVEDMLEEPAPGPASLRILASQKPARQNPAQQTKQKVLETKKQRQNRQRVEQQRQQREEDEKQRKALEEKQRRQAREARGEPAKNGITSAPAPKSNAWTATPAQADAASSQAPLLDTFDAESTSSSNDAQISTAATSTTDGAPAQWSDEPFSSEEISKTMAESEPWNEVKKKQKKKGTNQDTNGSITPVGAPIIVNGSAAAPPKPASSKLKGFSALQDEGASADPNDASNW